MLPNLHYYNPGHETVLLEGKANYTPTKNVKKMIHDLSLLPIWYANPEDYVYVDELHSPRFISLLPKEIQPKVTILTEELIRKKASSLPKMNAFPWGISPQSIQLYNQLKEDGLDIDVPLWKDEYIQLTKRQTAAKCLQDIQSLLPEFQFPSPPVFFSELSDIESYLLKKPGAFLLKTPLSSSGRGLHWLETNSLNEKDRNWINGALKKQKTISMEPSLNKYSDFAMEFYSDGHGNVSYQGLSLFGTNKRGAYKGNEVATQKELWSILTRVTPLDQLLDIQNAMTQTLQTYYAQHYAGYIGVDMMTYCIGNEYFIHPCVEINMRYTMGMVIIRLFERYLHSMAFGIFKIIYESNPNYMYEFHLQMKQAYPLKFKNGKLREGYIALCPVTKHTHYNAYIIVQ